MKKIKLTTVVMILLCLTTVISSCSKCDVIPEITGSESKLSNEDAKNVANEYDKYGEIHNLTLDFLGKKFGGKLLTTPIEEIKLALNDFAISLGYDKLKDEEYIVVEQALKCASAGPIEGGCIRDPFCVLFPRKCEFFDRLMKPWNYKTIESPDEIRSFITECKKFEQEIMADEKMAEPGNGLKALSIARYSAIYWQNQNSDTQNSVWSNELQSIKSVCWSCIVAGDALGALGGPFTAGLVSGLVLASQD